MQNKKISLWLWTLLLALLITVAAGCRPDEAVLPPDDDNNEETPEERTMEFALFFGEAEAIHSGKAGEYGFVAPVTRSAPANEDPLAAALAELIKGPRPEDGDFFSTLPPTAKVLSAQLEDRTARIDFSRELISDSPGGTLGGTVFMQSLVFTLTQFPGIEKVLVLVEGEPWSDGHFIWEEPLGPADMAVCPGC
ncbi:MAG: GerMN domain-containing protein [Dethiobacter sp.]|jgi:hypothetical protein|nr:GerMN domain-containing protein [Dethiobacter sp.]